MGTAGRAVVFAGATVVISMLGLLLVGLGWLSGMGVGVSATVLATMLTSTTLLPALLGLTHRRLELTRWRGLLAAGFAAVAILGVGIGSGPLAGAGAVLAVLTLVASIGRAAAASAGAAPPPATRRSNVGPSVEPDDPAPAVGVAGRRGAVVLLALAAPALGMRLAWTDEGNFPEATDTRRAYDLLAEGFGDGFNGPLVVTASAGPAARRPASSRRRRAARSGWPPPRASPP